MPLLGSPGWLVQSRKIEAAQLFDSLKRLMVLNSAGRQLTGKYLRLEVFLGNSRQFQTRVGLETEAAIVARVAQHYAANTAEALQLCQGRFHQGRANALALTIRPYGDRSESVPATCARRNSNR